MIRVNCRPFTVPFFLWLLGDLTQRPSKDDNDHKRYKHEMGVINGTCVFILDLRLIHYTWQCLVRCCKLSLLFKKSVAQPEKFSAEALLEKLQTPEWIAKLTNIFQTLTGLSVTQDQAKKLLNDGSQVNEQMQYKIRMDSKSKSLYLRSLYTLDASNNLEPQPEVKRQLSKFANHCGVGKEKLENPFKKFKFSQDPQNLFQKVRSNCKKCGKRQHIYCNYCMCDLDGGLPKLRLPINLTILRNKREARKKSSGIHAKIICPESVEEVLYSPEISPFNEPGTWLLFPGENAMYIEDMSKEQFEQVKRIVVIETTWKGNNHLLNDKKVTSLPCIQIRNRETVYWRYQEKSRNFLSTIEAIYWFYVEYLNKLKGSYNGELDDLLLLFALNFNRVMTEVKTNGQKIPTHWKAGTRIVKPET